MNHLTKLKMSIGILPVKTHILSTLILFLTLLSIIPLSKTFASNPNLTGDANSDNIVNIQDIAQVLRYYGTTNNTTDVNGDNIINIQDIATILGHYGKMYTPTGGGSTTCPLPAYPSASCTGVPAGTVLTNTVNNTYTVNTPGQVIDKWHITGDLHILADNVVITNSQIDGTVNNQGSGEDYYSFAITDSTVGPPSACTKDSPPSCQSGNNPNACIVAPGVGESKYTATRVYVRGHDDGFRLSGTGDGTVRDSYFYACYLNATYSQPDGSHSDGVQAVCAGNPCPVFNILHTTLDLSGVPATFPLNLTDPVLSSVTANDNLLLGGQNYLIYNFWHTGPNWIFHNNRLVQGTWGSDTRLIAAATADNTCSHQDWQGNTVVTIDNSYHVISTIQPIPCQD